MRAFLIGLSFLLDASLASAQELTWVRSVAFSPNGKLLASGGDDRRVRIWDASTGRLLRTWTAHTNHINQVSFRGDGRVLSTAGADGTIGLWDPSTGKLIRRLKAGTSYVSGATFSGTGPLLASAGYDNKAKLWHTSTGGLVRTFTGLPSDAYTVALSPNGKWVISGGGAEPVLIWNTQTGRPVGKTVAPDGAFSISVSRNSRQFTLCSGKGISVHMLPSGARMFSLQLGTDQKMESAVFSPDGKMLATSGYDHTIRLWDEDGEPVNGLDGHTDVVSSLAFSPDGKRLASGSYDSTVRLWDVDKGTLILRLDARRR